MPVRVRARRADRDLSRFPADDDALGMGLYAMVTDALARGIPAPALVTLWDAELNLYDLRPVLQASWPEREHLLAALAAQHESSCAALIGVLQVSRGRGASAQRAAVVYLEWPDNRWWTAWSPLDAERQPVLGEPLVRRAVDGAPRPGGVGGWYALSRRLGLKLRSDEWVH